MRTIALAMQKGGVGKTTLAVNLGAALAMARKRVLLVDMDPSASATGWLLGQEAGGLGVAEALREEKIRGEHLREVEGRPGLSILPATRALQALDADLREDAGHAVLRNVLRDVAARFDFVLIDTPPSLSSFTTSALWAADAVLAPVPAAVLPLGGLRLLEESIERLRRRVGLRARLVGAVLFAADPREAVTLEAREIVEKDRPRLLFKTEIRVSTAAKSLPASRATSLDPGADPRGREDYATVLVELLERLRRLPRD